MIRFILTLTFAFFSLLSVRSQDYIPGEIYFGENDYIEYRAGNLPIIISAAHGGSLEPSSIPDRNCSGCVYGADLFTEDLAKRMYDAIFEEFGCYPHVIINRLHRSKLDANRSIGEAADGNAAAELAWTEFQEFIESSSDSVEANYGKGLYIDLHGHGHDIQRLELGYLMSRSDLMLQDNQLDTDTYIDEASIKHLVSNNLENYEFSELLRGTYSLGQYYEEETYRAVPSANDPQPFSGESYFSGGYNTRRHGSRSSGNIDGIQIECNMDGVRNSFANRVAFANATAAILKQYLERHYFGVDVFANSSCGLVSSVGDLQGGRFDIVVSPNPVERFLKIELPFLTDERIDVSIVSQTGQVYFKGDYSGSSEIEVDVQQFESGVLFVKVQTENDFFIKRIIH